MSKKKNGKGGADTATTTAPAAVETKVETPAVAPVAAAAIPAVATTKVVKAKAVREPKFQNGKPMPVGLRLVSARKYNFRASMIVALIMVEGAERKAIVFAGDEKGEKFGYFSSVQAASEAFIARVAKEQNLPELNGKGEKNKRGVTGARFLFPEDTAENAVMREYCHEDRSSTEGIEWSAEGISFDPAPEGERKVGSGMGRGRPLDLSGKDDKALSEYRAEVSANIEALTKRLGKVDAEIAARAALKTA